MSAPASPRPRVFVSHSHHDNEWCRAFVAALQAAEWDVWYDEKGLGGGAAWVATIQRELQAREVFLLVLSPDAWDSRWVHEELNLALATNRHILPIVHQPTQVEGFLLTRQWVQVAGLPGAEAARRAEPEILRLVAQARVAPDPAPVAIAPAAPVSMPEERFPKRLADLGFIAARFEGAEVILPPLVKVPAGEFLMGGTKGTIGESERPEYSLDLSAFSIARFPVTVAEYACFVRVGHSEPLPAGSVGWSTQLKRLDHPVVCVTWYDALSYNVWLTRLSGQPWHLPTEAEWEKAARAETVAHYSRVYPWGDGFDKTRCNTKESGVGTTTPVGTYPNGASPCGAQDMAGNVWEWTSSLLKPYPYNQNDGREDANSAGNRVLRGGAWNDDYRYARAAYRDEFRPGGFVDNYGFRLALAASAGA